MPRKQLASEHVGYHDARHKFAVGNPGGKPGVSGRKPEMLAIRCQALTERLVIPIIEKYLQDPHDPSKPKASLTPKDRGVQWAAEYLRSYLPKGLQPIEGDLTLNVEDAQTLFTSRMDRLRSRLGSAAMPEGIDGG